MKHNTKDIIKFAIIGGITVPLILYFVGFFWMIIGVLFCISIIGIFLGIFFFLVGGWFLMITTNYLLLFIVLGAISGIVFRPIYQNMINKIQQARTKKNK